MLSTLLLSSLFAHAAFAGVGMPVPLPVSGAAAAALLSNTVAVAPSISAAAVAPFSVVSSAQARNSNWSDSSPFRYSYVEIGATQFDTDDIDDEADTYYGEVSFEILNLINVFGGYENFSTNFDNTDTDIWTLGAGAHFSARQDVDLTADIAWLFSQIDSDTLDEDSNGARVRAGLRWMALDADAVDLELFGRGIYLNLEDSIYSDDDLWGFDAGLRVHFIEYLSVAGTYTKLEDNDSIGVSARFSF